MCWSEPYRLIVLGLCVLHWTLTKIVSAKSLPWLYLFWRQSDLYAGFTAGQNYKWPLLVILKWEFSVFCSERRVGDDVDGGHVMLCRLTRKVSDERPKDTRILTDKRGAHSLHRRSRLGFPII